jgi:uncharacterized protein (TIGR02145 family)
MAEGTLVITISNQVTAPVVTAGIFITGWHVPTFAELQTLNTYLGGSLVSGGYLKDSGLINWDAPNTGADNASGFTAFGSGLRDNTGAFLTLKANHEMWTATETSATRAAFLFLSKDDAVGLETQQFKEFGCSLRLIKDDSVNPGTVLDYDGYLYNTVKIGTQVWMAANLRTTHWADGTPIPIVTDNAAWAALTTAGMCYYNNTP